MPPTPDESVCMPITQTATYTSLITTVITSYAPGPGGKLSTLFRTTTNVVPITEYEEITKTTELISTQTTTDINYQPVTSTYFSTISGAAVLTTVTSFVTVPRTLTSTIVSTITSVTTITKRSTYTDVITNVVTNTLTKTDLDTVTDYIRVPGPDVTRSTVQTLSKTTTIQTQPPPVVVTQTITSQSIKVTTTVIQPPPSVLTSTKTSSSIYKTTQIQTEKDEITKTQPYVSTRTIFKTITDTSRRTVTSTSEVVKTSQSILKSTSYTTQIIPTTIVRDDVATVTVTQPEVYKTVTKTISIPCETFPSTITSEITTTLKRTVTVTGEGGREIVSTTVIRGDCGTSGYNYNPPAVPFNF